MEEAAFNSSRLSDVVSLEKISNHSNDSDLELTNVFHNHDYQTAVPKFPLIPTSVLIAYLVCVNGSGVILNLFVIGKLWKKRIDGIRSLMLQMAIADILSLTIVGIPEMWSHHEGSWSFGARMCTLYLGGEVFAGTSSAYFLIVFTFHALVTANIQSRGADAKKYSDEDLLEDSTEMKSSRHSLVSRNESSGTKISRNSRDHEKSQIVPVVIPVMLVWILAASLSVPEFALSTLIDSRGGPSVCTFVDGNRMLSMQILLSVFQLVIPLTILLGSSGTIAYRLFKITSKGKDMQGESPNVLRMSLFLCLVYFSLNAPRYLLAGAHVWSGPPSSPAPPAPPSLEHFRTPPLGNTIAPVFIPFSLSFLYFLTSVIKPICYIYFVNKSNDNVFRIIKCEKQEE